MFTDAELDFLLALVTEEWNYWETNLETDDDKKVAIIVGTILGKLHGDTAVIAERDTRRLVDEWWAKRTAPGGL